MKSSLLALCICCVSSLCWGQYQPSIPRPNPGHRPSYDPRPVVPRPTIPRPDYTPRPSYQGGYQPHYEPRTLPTTTYIEENRCTNCNKVVSSSARPGQNCPHCGIYWANWESEGSSSSSSSSSGYRSRASRRAEFWGKLFSGDPVAWAIMIGALAVAGLIGWLKNSASQPRRPISRSRSWDDEKPIFPQ